MCMRYNLLLKKEMISIHLSHETQAQINTHKGRHMIYPQSQIINKLFLFTMSGIT